MTRSSPSRKTRRLEKKSAAKPRPRPQLQSVRLDAKVLADLDHNSKIFRDTLIVLDMSVQSIAAVVDDLACGRAVEKTTIDGVEHVDYNVYLDRFKKTLDKMRADKQQPEAPPMTPPLVSTIAAPTDEDVRVFGGTGDQP